MRHAQRHWLGMQADAAVELACRITIKNAHEKAAVDIEGASLLPNADIEILTLRREFAIAAAAAALTVAELLHREIVSRGGKP